MLVKVNLGIEEASIQANVGAIVGYQHGGSIAQMLRT